MKNNFIFINRLKDLMQNKSLSTNKLAKAISCNNTAVARWLSGLYFPRYFLLIKLADYFECSVDFLLGLTDDETPLKNNLILNDFKTQYCKRKETLKLSDYQIAKRLNIEQSTISKWIRRNQQPEVNTLINLSKIFNCSVEYLLGRTDF